MAAVFLLGLVGLAFTGSIPGLSGLNFSPLIQDSQTVRLEDYYVNARNGEIISDVSNILVVPLWLMVLVAPLLLLLIYRRYGREETIPGQWHSLQVAETEKAMVGEYDFQREAQRFRCSRLLRYIA